MSQDTIAVSDGSGLEVREGFNAALVSLATLFSGAAEPNPTYAYMLWADETDGLLKQRTSDNQSWITVGTLDKTNWGLAPGGFGLGGLTQRLANNAGLDVRTSGFFSAYTTANGALPLDNYCFIPMPINAINTAILAIRVSTCDVYVASQAGGVWSAWRKI